MEIGNPTSIPGAAISPALAQEGGTLPSRQTSHEGQPAVSVQGSANDQKSERKKLEDAVETANELVQSFADRHLNFSIDKETERLVVRVVDDKGEVVRQIPAKEMLNLIAHFDKIKALLFSGKY